MLLLVVIQWVELELQPLLRYGCSRSGDYKDLHDDLTYVTQRDVVGYGSLYLAQAMELEGTMGLLGSKLPLMCALRMAPDPGLELKGIQALVLEVTRILVHIMGGQPSPL